MPRPKRKRFIAGPPVMEGFKPFGIPVTNLQPLILLYEEYETIRLLDYEGMTQAEAAAVMNISRPTLTRIYEKARRTIAEAFVLGKAIFIQGGDYQSEDYWYRCGHCHRLIITGSSREECTSCTSKELTYLSNTPHIMYGRKETGHCICPHCNTRTPHRAGVPCREEVCPACGKKMVREGSYHHQLIIQKKGEKSHEDRSTKQ